MNNVWAGLPCRFLLDPLKRGFLGIDLTMFLGDRDIGNTSAMRVIFFLKIFQIETRFQKKRKKLRQRF